MSTPELHWFKSSYSSGPDVNDCVELALTWHKSSYSDSSNGNDCVEFAPTPTTLHLRASQTLEGPCLTVAPTTWTAFVTYSAGTQ